MPINCEYEPTLPFEVNIWRLAVCLGAFFILVFVLGCLNAIQPWVIRLAHEYLGNKLNTPSEPKNEKNLPRLLSVKQTPAV